MIRERVSYRQPLIIRRMTLTSSNTKDVPILTPSAADTCSHPSVSAVSAVDSSHGPQHTLCAPELHATIQTTAVPRYICSEKKEGSLNVSSCSGPETRMEKRNLLDLCRWDIAAGCRFAPLAIEFSQSLKIGLRIAWLIHTKITITDIPRVPRTICMSLGSESAWSSFESGAHSNPCIAVTDDVFWFRGLPNFCLPH
ncbi:hypothetical protein PIB30_022939 [Stylosanthes scabra]|uniref:Uncharacterized protein n=1 Tax=Stylosanthes scabra TaxID=79078 RepID=A0ABU6R9J6_9FABA|nr:hypothetical protein [Stylosanthes scabra]